MRRVKDGGDDVRLCGSRFFRNVCRTDWLLVWKKGAKGMLDEDGEQISKGAEGGGDHKVIWNFSFYDWHYSDEVAMVACTKEGLTMRTLRSQQ